MVERMSRIAGLLAALATLLWVFHAASAQISPHQAVAQMGRGINMGNTLEPETEGGWNNGPAREYYFDDYRNAGFATVRIPIRWDRHTQTVAPYAISSSWLDRVEEIADWGLSRDLFIVINGHHEDWLKKDYGNPKLRARYDSIWSQVATRFRDKSEKLLFEIMNEPFGMSAAEVDDLNARVLGIIRRTNPTRNVIYSGAEWSGPDHMMAAAIPDDPYVIAYFHTYDPWSFAGLAQGTWGTAADRQSIADMFQRVADWSARNNVPITLSEFGSVHAADFNSRMAHYAAYVEECLKYGIAFQVWDDGGDFEVYRREERTWHDAKDILIGTGLGGPTDLAISVDGDSVATLSWVNRSSASTISVERQDGDGQYTVLAELDGSATRYADTTVVAGVTYTYRVIARPDQEAEMCSFPVRVRIRPTTRSAFHGSPFVIPGTIEAEDYDIGGEGLTYHDTDDANIPGAYRPNESVDIEPRDEGGFQVAYIESGEWLDYTVDVQEGGDYHLTAYVASMDGGGQFRFKFPYRYTRTLTVPSTNSWQTLTAITTSRPISLTSGVQIMRAEIGLAHPFNIDRFVIEKATSTSVSASAREKDVEIYPNPVRRRLRVSHSEVSPHEGRVEVHNVMGQLVKTAELGSDETDIGLDDMSAGVYFVRVIARDRVVAAQAVVKQ
jgi:hypothetical protein